MVKVMNLQRTSEASCGSSFKGQLPVEVEIQVKEGWTSLDRTSSKYKLVYNGLNQIQASGKKQWRAFIVFLKLTAEEQTLFNYWKSLPSKAGRYSWCRLVLFVI